MKRVLIFIAGALTLLNLCSCQSKRSNKEELTLQFNAYTFETLDGKNKFEGAETPWIKDSATFRFYPDSLIVLQVPTGLGNEVNTHEMKWSEKNEDGKRGTEYILVTDWSGYRMLKLRKDTTGQIIAAAFTKSDYEKLVYFNIKK
jgi:hypothetical protein